MGSSSYNAFVSTTAAAKPELSYFHPTLRRWFLDTFEKPTTAQQKSWPVIADGKNTLLLAPTGSGKTLSAFLVAINRIMFGPRPAEDAPRGVRTLYISPLKALGVDVERNLRSPLAGVRVAALRDDVEHHIPTIAVRSGDTPSAERTRITRDPPDILITTPESLYLMLTSRAREVLGTVDTIIIDEIHSMVATKRGSHLFVTLERLEELRRRTNPEATSIQRIGLSATQRPLDEIARLLGGAEVETAQSKPKPRPVEIVEAGRKRKLDLTIEVPVEDMTELAASAPPTDGPGASPSIPSIWPAIHPRLVELIKSHRSTMIFVNSRRLAERLSAAINELADEEIAMAHHGSIAKDMRLLIEDRLKRGQLPAIVATSSLELGIDMGAVDLVIQIEAPPTIASGIQRIGRAGHQVGAVSEGVIFPKFRGDLLACSAAAEKMFIGEVEETFYPRNPLDVLAQQIVAMAALETISLDETYNIVRRSAPFCELPRSVFESVLDLLSGRYPSDEFSELRPRITWDRIKNEISPRKGTQRLAILNAGTIPDRGLYGVFLVGDESSSGSRVGELDEEMVFETRPGDVFLLGASSWRVMEITHDRVLVTPAPGEPGRMPFWRGDGPGRPLDFGRAIGALTRRLLKMSRDRAEKELVEKHALESLAARNLIDYLRDQSEATGEVPSDKTIVVESFLDEVGDWRVTILTPFGSRVHAPWATAVMSRLRDEMDGEVDMVWTDDGIMFRMPNTDSPPSLEILLPRSDTVEETITNELGQTALFAARFRENAARALLLPRQNPGRRTPLWVQRRKSADLLKVASQFRNFPILLETYRECLRDVFDIRGLTTILQDIERRAIQVRSVASDSPSPFASTLLFTYTANFLYDGDAPLAERRARSLALDYSQLKELLGDAELRELLDADTVDEVSLVLQRLDGKFPIKSDDGLHDLLLKLGDLSRDELALRSSPELQSQLDRTLQQMESDRRVIQIRISGEIRFAAAEDASRFRDALGVMPPPGLPDAFMESVEDPLGDLVSRYARTHVPFQLEDVAARFGIGKAVIRETLQRLVAKDRLLEGEFLPGGRGREWCDSEVLRMLKRKSLARLRKQIEPVSHEALARFLPTWQSITNPRRGLDGLLDVIEQLQGVPLPASTLEHEILPARVNDFKVSDLDELCTAGEVVWRGFEKTGTGDGRIGLYLADSYLSLNRPTEIIDGELHDQIRERLAERGASFFDDIAKDLGGFRNDILNAMWDLVWAGEITNDTLAPLRSLRRSTKPASKSRSKLRSRSRAFRSRRTSKSPGSEGRWSLLVPPNAEQLSTTEKQTALATQLIERYGVLTREMVASEGILGSFSGIYPVLKAMEEAGRIRRGYFVAGLGAAQFAAAGAEDRLRDMERASDPDSDDDQTMILAATDPANPYGSALRWPESESGARPQRVAGARVLMQRGILLGYLGRTGMSLLTFLPDTNPERAEAVSRLMDCLQKLSDQGEVVYLTKINGAAPQDSSINDALLAAGFVPSAKGYQLRVRTQNSDRKGYPYRG